MTETLRKLALILLAPPSLLLAYELIYNWFVKNTFEFGKLKFWMGKVAPNAIDPTKHIIAAVTSSAVAEKIFNMPAFFVLYMLPLFFYVVYRIIFLIQGGKQGGYKSRY